ncbi:hypothetical protein WR25_11156 isoform B [Diploscapter pachys]|uniref:Uncharacterized protein n=1 Tax=Diploscapter pachys TaxID=2018661 RepID=A0A2A2JJI4_9BILA|nr:hypothetical protein WR25_11156 isoform B [Diploscapter pachys]
MLKLLAILIFTNTVASWESEVCCCGCESPCEITLKDSCGAPPITPCIMKSNFNKEELLSPCSMVLKLHKYEISGVKPIETDYNAITTAPAQNGDSSSHYRYGQVIPGKKTFESSQIKFSGSESHQYIPIPRKVDKESLVSKTGEKTVIGLGYSSEGSYNAGSSGSYNPGPVSSYNAGSSGSYNPGPVSSYNSGSSSSYNSGSGMSHSFERKRRQVENSHSQVLFLK